MKRAIGTMQMIQLCRLPFYDITATCTRGGNSFLYFEVPFRTLQPRMVPGLDGQANSWPFL